MDYMTFKRSQCEYHLLPYKCLVCIEHPAMQKFPLWNQVLPLSLFYITQSYIIEVQHPMLL